MACTVAKNRAEPTRPLRQKSPRRKFFSQAPACAELTAPKGGNCIGLAASCMKSHDRLECFRRDPIGFSAGDVNLYRYVGNGPILRIDASGHDIITEWPTSDPNPESGGIDWPWPEPIEWPRPAKLTPNTYAVCGRIIQGNQRDQRLARCCGFLHVDVYSEEEGMIRWGGLGAIESGTPGIPTGDDFKCVTLYRQDKKRYFRQLYPLPPWPFPQYVDRKVTWGRAAGKRCVDVTDRDITDCLKSKPRQINPPDIFENCTTDVEDAVRGCCLSGYLGDSLRNLIIITGPKW